MRGKGLILDTNLLLLLVVGTASKKYISRHKRLRAYSDMDFERIVSQGPKAGGELDGAISAGAFMMQKVHFAVVVHSVEKMVRIEGIDLKVW